MSLKPLNEIEEVVNSKVMGPVLRLSLEDLWKYYQSLRSAFIAETDGSVDVDEAQNKFLVRKREPKFNQNLTES